MEVEVDYPPGMAFLFPRRYSNKYPFRVRSETADIAITLSMQPWEAFRPDGVIMFSDILTPLPALGIEFDVIRGKGPLIADPIRRYGAQRHGAANRCLHCGREARL